MKWPIRRVVVAGDSMLPTYREGEWLLVARLPVRVGDAVLARRPDRRNLWIVKRVASRSADEAFLVGDNPASSTDSRHFGPVPLALVAGRVVGSYRPGTT